MAQEDAFQCFLSMLERSPVADKLGTLRDAIKEDSVSENQPENSGRVLNMMGEILDEMLASHDEAFPAALKNFADLARSGEWRGPIGTSTVFQTALQVVRDGGKTGDLPGLEQSLRILGNCSADNDSIREILAGSEDNFLALLLYIGGPLGTLALSTLYNACLDNDQAQRLFIIVGGISTLTNNPNTSDGNELACGLLEIVCCNDLAPEMTTGDDCLYLLRVCSNLLEQESFGMLTGAVLPLLTSSQHQSLLTHYVFLETYADVVERAHRFTVQSSGEDSEFTPEDDAASISLFHSLIAKLYEVTATSHFDQKPNAEVVEQLCDIFSATEEQNLSAKNAVHLITLANMTRSDDFAVGLAQRSVPQAAIVKVEQALDSDNKILAPVVIHAGLQLLRQAALPMVNRASLLRCGTRMLLSILTKTAAFTEEIQIDTLTLARRLVAGSSESLLRFNALGRLNEQDALPLEHEENYGIRQVLNVFKLSEKRSLRLEVGRFAAEIARTFGPLSGSESSAISTWPLLFQSFDDVIDLVEPLGYVVSNAQSLGAKTEGWFALGILSSWPEGGLAITQYVQRDAKLLETLHEASNEQDAAQLDNIRVMLTNLAKSQVAASPAVQEIFENAATKAGLDSLHIQTESKTS